MNASEHVQGKTLEEESFMTPEDQPELKWAAAEIQEKSRESILQNVPRNVRQEVWKRH